jgi:hypothetical protein
MRRALLALAACLTVGCTLAPPEPGQARRAAREKQITSPDGLVLAHNTRKGMLYVRPDHHIGTYDAFLVEPVMITYRRGQRPLSVEDADKLDLRLQELTRQEIRLSTVSVRDEPDECTLKLQLYLTDVVLLDREPKAGSSFLSSSGSLTMVMEFRDSLSDAPLLRYGQRKGLPGGRVIGIEGELSSGGLMTALRGMLVDIGVEVRRLTPATKQEGARPGGTLCKGTIQGESTRPNVVAGP